MIFSEESKSEVALSLKGFLFLPNTTEVPTTSSNATLLSGEVSSCSGGIQKEPSLRIQYLYTPYRDT